MSEHEPAAVWNGEPILALTHDQSAHLCQFLPNWHGGADGPPIPFGTGRARISVSGILAETRKEAAEHIWRHIQEACIEQGLMYDEREWTITHVKLVNGS